MAIVDCSVARFQWLPVYTAFGRAVVLGKASDRLKPSAVSRLFVDPDGKAYCSKSIWLVVFTLLPCWCDADGCGGVGAFSR